MKKTIKKVFTCFICVSVSIVLLVTTTMAASKLSIVNINAGNDNGFFTGRDGKLYSWDNNKKVVQINGVTNVNMSATDMFGYAYILDKSGIIYRYNHYSPLEFTNKSKISGINSVVSISSGCESLYALKKDGTVWKILNNELDKVPGLSNVISISARNYDVMALKKDGTVWEWSDGSFYLKILESSPLKKVQGLTNVIQIEQGADHRVALKKDGTVWCWGDNTSAQLGTSKETTNSTVPVKVSNLKNISKIAAGRMNSLALDKKGYVWVWGSSYVGKTYKNNFTAVKVPDISGIKMIASGGRDYNTSGEGGFSYGKCIAVNSKMDIWIWGPDAAIQKLKQ